MSDKVRDALEGMVYQFGYRSDNGTKPTIWTGGLSALEGAFDALGWDEPHEIQEDGNTCEIEGCLGECTSGGAWVDYGWGPEYILLCSEHFRLMLSGAKRLPIKSYAIEREKRRDTETGILKSN